jgi:EmrB/QacA subfamily drug resistance transporter
LVTIGLTLGAFIASLSEAVVSTVTDTIANDLKSFGALTWIAGGYMLSLVAFCPLFGKLSDIFDRKPVMVFSVIIFALGSLGCALASTMPMLIGFRILSGVGGSGLLSLSYIMVSDIIPLESRSSYLSLVSTIFALSNILGPIIGGIIAEYSWRGIFYLQIPPCIVLGIIVVFVLDLPKSEGNMFQRLKRVDFLGCITLTVSVVLLVLATNWGGKEYEWHSVLIITLFSMSLVIFIIFIIIEWKFAYEPILPGRIFNRDIILVNAAQFFAGAIRLVMVFYFPIYFQNVKGLTPSQSGYQLIPFILSISIFSVVSGYLAQLVRSIRGVMWFGSVISLIGVCLFAFLPKIESTPVEMVVVVVNGMGLGLYLQLITLTCQVSVPQEDVAISTGFSGFSTNIGGVIGIAVIGSVFDNTLVDQISKHLSEYTPHQLILPEIVKNLSSEQVQLLRNGYFESFQLSFKLLIPFNIITIMFLLGLTNIKIDSKKVFDIESNEIEIKN